jgi:hypothetical protein
MQLVVPVAALIACAVVAHLLLMGSGRLTPSGARMSGRQPSIAHWGLEWPARRETEALKLVLSGAVPVENGEREVLVQGWLLPFSCRCVGEVG